MKKYLLLILVCIAIGIFIRGQSSYGLPRYTVKNKTRNMVKFVFVVSYPLSTEIPAIGGIHEGATVPDIFERVQDPTFFEPLQEMIISLRATFYENQYTFEGNSYPLGQAFFNGPMPLVDSTFVLTGPDENFKYSLDKM